MTLIAISFSMTALAQAGDERKARTAAVIESVRTVISLPNSDNTRGRRGDIITAKEGSKVPENSGGLPISGQIFEFADQPKSGVKPASLGDSTGNVGNPCRLFGSQPAEEDQIDDQYVIKTNVTEVPDGHAFNRSAGFASIAPNPFNPATEFRFRLEEDDLTQLNVYDLRGNLVTQLVNERLVGGVDHVLRWDGTDQQGRNVVSGIYFARLRIGTSVSEIRKLTLVK